MSENQPAGIEGVVQRAKEVIHTARTETPQVGELLKQGKGREALKVMAGWLKKSETSSQDTATVSEQLQSPVSKDRNNTQTVVSTKGAKIYKALSSDVIDASEFF